MLWLRCDFGKTICSCAYGREIDISKEGIFETVLRIFGGLLRSYPCRFSDHARSIRVLLSWQAISPSVNSSVERNREHGWFSM